jgi:hypothetical protein
VLSARIATHQHVDENINRKSRFKTLKVVMKPAPTQEVVKCATNIQGMQLPKQPHNANKGKSRHPGVGEARADAKSHPSKVT